MLWCKQTADPIHLRNNTHDPNTIQLSWHSSKAQTKAFMCPEQNAEIDWISMRIFKMGITWPGRGAVICDCSPCGSTERPEILLPKKLMAFWWSAVTRQSAVALPSPLGTRVWFLNNYQTTWGTWWEYYLHPHLHYRNLWPECIVAFTNFKQILKRGKSKGKTLKKNNQPQSLKQTSQKPKQRKTKPQP